MKNEPWIDRVYKEKIESWNIPIESAHWEQAASMIDAQNQKKKKRILWFWLLGLFIVAGGILISTSWSGQKAEPVKSEPQPIPSHPANEPIALENSTPSSLKSETPANAAKPLVENNNSKSESPVVQAAQLTSKSNKKVEKVNLNSSAQNLVAKQSKSITNDNSPGEITLKPGELQSQESMVTNQSIESNAIDNKQEMTRGDQALNKLPSTNPELAYAEQPLLLPETFVPIQIEARTKKWKELGLRLGLAKQTESARTNAISALGVEIYSQKQLGGKGYWGLSLGYNSFFNSSLYSEVLTSYQYKGFGSVVQNFGVKPEWMHYLYLQANMGMQLKKHRGFIGVKPELLLGALGKVDQLKFKEGSPIKDLATAEVSSFGNGWLQKGSLHQLVWNAHLGYEYQFHPKICIGVQANRHLNGLYRPLPGDVSQTNIAKWNLGMRVSYKIK